MKIDSKNPFRRIARWFTRSLEDSLTIDPEQSGNTSGWIEQKLSYNFPSFSNIEKLQPDTSGLNWLREKKVARPGICLVEKSKVWMLCASKLSPNDPYQRQAVIFNERYRRLKTPGARRIIQHLIRGEWRRLWKNRKKVVHLEGRVAVLGNFVLDCRNYYHFWADTVADLWFLRQLLPENQMPQRYLIPFSNLPWQNEILDICGIRPDQIIPFFEYDLLTVDTLIVPIRDKGAENLPIWQAEAIRSVADWNTHEQKRTTRRIYLSRDDAPRRRVANETQVREYLTAYGFEVHMLTGLSVKEQQALFASAAVIVSPHGAALTNLVWCHPGTIVIDFLSEKFLVPCFKELAKQSGVIYYPIICHQEINKKEVIERDIEIAPEKLDIALNFVKDRSSKYAVSP